MNRWFAVLLGLAVANVGLAQENTIRIGVTTGKHNYENVPICVPLSVPAEWAKLGEVEIGIITGKDPGKAIGQLTAPGLARTRSNRPRRAWFAATCMSCCRQSVRSGTGFSTCISR